MISKSISKEGTLGRMSIILRQKCFEHSLNMAAYLETFLKLGFYMKAQNF